MDPVETERPGSVSKGGDIVDVDGLFRGDLASAQSFPKDQRLGLAVAHDA